MSRSMRSRMKSNSSSNERNTSFQSSSRLSFLISSPHVLEILGYLLELAQLLKGDGAVLLHRSHHVPHVHLRLLHRLGVVPLPGGHRLTYGGHDRLVGYGRQVRAGV